MSGQSKLKFLAKRVVLASRGLRLVQTPGIAVLMYHSVREAPRAYANVLGPIVHATSIFRRQMEMLARRCTPVSMDDILRFAHHQIDLPPQCFAVTFDDGYADNLEVAAPILEQLGIPGAFYPTVNYIGTQNLPWVARLRHAFFTSNEDSWTGSNGAPGSLLGSDDRQQAFAQACQDLGGLAGNEQENAIRQIEAQLRVQPLSQPDLMLSWGQLRALASRGHTIGSHTLCHPNLAHVKDDATLRHELVESKRQLDAQLGVSVRHFSYPVPVLTPHWTSHTVEMTRDAGYATAITTTPGLVHRGDNLLSLRRVRPAYNMDEFRWVLECSLAGRTV
jgi:peptidoglycan/xylan/chitin deacetylase (PgdA/CDA1 family)